MLFRKSNYAGNSSLSFRILFFLFVRLSSTFTRGFFCTKVLLEAFLCLHFRFELCRHKNIGANVSKIDHCFLSFSPYISMSRLSLVPVLFPRLSHSFYFFLLQLYLTLSCPLYLSLFLLTISFSFSSTLSLFYSLQKPHVSLTALSLLFSFKLSFLVLSVSLVLCTYGCIIFFSICLSHEVCSFAFTK